MRLVHILPAAAAILLTCCGDVPQGALSRARVTTRPCGREATEAGRTRCALGEAQAAQVRLGMLMDDLGRTLDSARLAELGRIQREWTRWRHRHCTWDAAAFAGEGRRSMRYANCVAWTTQARIDDLKYQLCPDGGAAGDCVASRRYDQ